MAQDFDEVIKSISKLNGLISSAEFNEILIKSSFNDGKFNLDLNNIPTANDELNTLYKTINNLKNKGIPISELISQINSHIKQEEGQAGLSELKSLTITTQKDLYNLKDPKNIPPHYREFDENKWKNLVGIKIDVKDTNATDVKEKYSESTKKNTIVSTIEWHHPNLNFSTRDVVGTEIMLSNIPNLEISRAIPYFDCKVIVKDDSYNHFEKSSKSISIYKFLNDGIIVPDTIQYDFVNSTYNIADFRKDNVYGNREQESSTSMAGMEIFTSPQTMVNANSIYRDLDLTKGKKESVSKLQDNVVDKFRPFMTFQSFNLEVTPATGMLATKAASMKLTLHDRSRMGEIVPLISPGSIGDVEFLIEYGWSHPDSDPNSNPYGALINSMRVKEKYGVMNSSYSFTDDGQVDIDLKLYTKGSRDSSFELVTPLEEGQDHPLDMFKKLVEKITLAKKNIEAGGTKLNADIGAPDVLGKISSVKGILNLKKEQKKEINDFLDDMSKGTSTLTDGFKKLKDAWTGAEQQTESFSSKVSDNFTKSLNSITDGEDPWCAMNYNLKINSGKTKTHVSLNKILLEMVGKPLVRTGKFDEIQFHYYPMNEFSMFASDINLAQYPINKKRFKEYMLEFLKSSPTITIQTLLNFLNTEFMGNKADDIYGLSKYYTRDDEGKYSINDTWTSSDAQKRKFAKIKHDLMEECYLDGEKSFKMPKIHMWVESVPISGTNGNGTVLKLHFFDQAATSYSSFSQLWRQTMDSSLGIISKYKNIMGEYEELLKKDIPPKVQITVADVPDFQLKEFSQTYIKGSAEELQRLKALALKAQKFFNGGILESIKVALPDIAKSINFSIIKQRVGLYYPDLTIRDVLALVYKSKDGQYGGWDSEEGQKIALALYHDNSIIENFDYTIMVWYIWKWSSVIIMGLIKYAIDLVKEIAQLVNYSTWISDNITNPSGIVYGTKTYEARWNDSKDFILTLFTTLHQYGGSIDGNTDPWGSIYRDGGWEGILKTRKNSLLSQYNLSIQNGWETKVPGRLEEIFRVTSPTFLQLDISTSTKNEKRLIHWISDTNGEFMNPIVKAETKKISSYILQKYPSKSAIIAETYKNVNEGIKKGIREFFDKISGKADSSLINTYFKSFYNGNSSFWSGFIKKYRQDILSGSMKDRSKLKLTVNNSEYIRQQQLLKQYKQRRTLYQDQINSLLEYFRQIDLLEPINVKTKGGKTVQKYRVKGGAQAIKAVMMKYMPTIKYGTSNSGVISAQLATQSNPAMETIHMQRQLSGKRTDDIEPYDDGLPLLVKPVELSLDSFGCPFLNFGQQFFVDFNTNSSVDDMYIVTGLSHSIVPGEYKSQIKLMPLNRLGVYRSLVDNFDDAIAIMGELAPEEPTTTPTTN